MIDEKHIDLVHAYLEGSMTADQKLQLNKLIDEGEIDIIDLKEMERVYRQLGSLPEPEPAESVRERFYHFLQQEKKNQKRTASHKVEQAQQYIKQFTGLPRLAYAAAIFLVGILIGNLMMPLNGTNQKIEQLSSEVYQMREMMALTLLDNSSPTERLKAVNISSDIQNANSRIIDALFQTLNNDPNVNVRLAAIDALLKHHKESSVRERLVNSITVQESPVVQVALADAMVTIQEKRSIDEFKKLLEQDQLDQDVRNKLEHTIAALN